MNRKLLVNVSLVAALGGCLCFGIAGRKAFNNLSRADTEPYSFSFGLVTESEALGQSGTYIGQTALGNEVKVNYNGAYKYGNNQFCYYPDGAYWEINADTQLSGITSLEFDVVETSGQFTIHYGWFNSVTESVDYPYSVLCSASRGGSFKKDLSDYKPNYIKVVSGSGFAFDNATIKYECTPSDMPFKKVGDYTFSVGETECELINYSGPTGSTVDLVLPSTCDGKPVTKVAPDLCKNKELNSVVIPGSYKEIGSYAFDYCYLKSLTLNEGLETIRNSAFSSNDIQGTVNIPDSVMSIGSSAFMDNSHMNPVIGTGSQLLRIENAAFRNCAMEYCYIPNSCIGMYEDFLYNPKLTHFIVENDNPYFTVINGVLYDKDVTQLKKYPEGKTDETYVMPNTVKEIPDYRLRSSYIKNITFSSELTLFGGYSALSNLESINFNNWKVTALQSYSFSRMNNLTEITIPEGVKSINGIALAENEELVTINLPSTITSIDNRYSMCGNPKLTTINFAGTVAQWIAIGKTNFTSSASGGCPLLTQITCSDGVVTL